MALLGRPDDPTMDVTARWPDEDNREAVRLGTILITGVEENEACDASIFNPANLAEGIGQRSSGHCKWSEKGHSTKSLRSSPLRGSKSREAGSRLRG
jgi:hypothetical protein